MSVSHVHPILKVEGDIFENVNLEYGLSQAQVLKHGIQIVMNGRTMQCG